MYDIKEFVSTILNSEEIVDDLSGVLAVGTAYMLLQDMKNISIDTPNLSILAKEYANESTEDPEKLAETCKQILLTLIELSNELEDL